MNSDQHLGEDGTPEPASVDPAKAALARARARARRESARGTAKPGGTGQHRSGARDPVTAGEAVDGLVVDLGWEERTSVAALSGRWEQIVGPDVAAHVAVERYDEGTLVVRADSTAWATQVRLLLPTLMARIVEEVGEGVVTRVDVLGPAAPSWTKGPRTAPGRGPRDTYG